MPTVSRPARPAPPPRAGRLLAGVLILAALSTLIGLNRAPLLDWDENMQSEVARQIMVTGDVLQLQLNGQPFTEKPPLFFLEMAGFFKLFGVSELTARMTSAVNGLLFLAALFALGRVLVDAELAGLWCLLYASALLPLIFSRAAIIEHTFNALMALGALCLVAYDESLARASGAPGGAPRGAGAPGPTAGAARFGPLPQYWAWLLAAAAALGLAVLAKGPSGGAVPLVAYAGYKAVRRGVPLRLGHWLACGALSVAIALSWYAANYTLHGGTFLREFARFMGLLFGQSLEGHSGPFYYHWAVALVGLFPWTPLLLLYALPGVRAEVFGDPRTRALGAMALVWAGFILAVFTLVKTKLPHYSSGMYVPLTLLSALALGAAVRSRGRVPLWTCALIAAYGLAVAVGLALLPGRIGFLAQAYGAGLEPPLEVPPLAWWPGAVLGAGIVAGAGILAWGRTLAGAAVIAAAMGAGVTGAWTVHLPLIAAYNQGPVIALMDEAYSAGGDLAFYRTVSYAALFYGEADINMIGTYKFAGDEARLDTPGPDPLYVVAPRQEEAHLRVAHPQLVRVRGLGDLVMYRLPPAGGK